MSKWEKYNFIYNKNYIKETRKNENTVKIDELDNTNVSLTKIIQDKYFETIKKIDINEIIVSGTLDSEKVLQYTKNYYYEKHFFAPVYIVLKDDCYYAVGNAEIVQAAKKMNIKKVFCKFGTEDVSENENKYREIGTVIKVNEFIGSVYNSTEEQIWLVNQNGESRKFYLDYLLKNNRAEIVDNKQLPYYMTDIEKAMYIYHNRKKEKFLKIDYPVIKKDNFEVLLKGVKVIYEKVFLEFFVINKNLDIYQPHLKKLKIDGRIVINDLVLSGNLSGKNIQITLPDMMIHCRHELDFYVAANTYFQSESIIINFDIDNNIINARKESVLIKKPEQKKKIDYIDSRSFVIRADNFDECSTHNVVNVKASIDIFDGNEVNTYDVQAFYCYTCGIYYIMESEYNRVKQYGRLICQILSLKEYKNLQKQKGLKFNPESILKSFGYNVADKEHLSEKTRRTILEVIVEENVLTKTEVVDYLKFFIRYHPHAPKAIEKWSSDIEYLKGYNRGNPRYIRISKMIR